MPLSSTFAEGIRLIFIHNEYQKILLAPKARVNPNQSAKITSCSCLKNFLRRKVSDLRCSSLNSMAALSQAGANK
jgi:hypothetical protein